MTSTSTWKAIDLPSSLLEEDIFRALRALPVPARYSGLEQDVHRIEICCASIIVESEAETHLRQAVADQMLRRKIEARAGDRIAGIVDAVVLRVSGT